MGAVWGNNIQFTIFGESHGTAIGGVLSNLPAGFDIDFAKVDYELSRRNHRAFYSTSRAEPDKYEILSGVMDGRVTGAPLAFEIRNCDTRSGDYARLDVIPRPGHSDYPASVRYGGANDYRGGGHFSGRITAPLVFAGAIARQYLATRGINLCAHIASIGNVQGKRFDEMGPDRETTERLHGMMFPVLDESYVDAMRGEIEACRAEGDSVGGVIECAITGLDAGIGEPFFGSVESELARMLFSIPAVKGVEFGAGFDIAHMKGSQANDPYRMENGKVTAVTNRNGGILGGITNGAAVIFRMAVKPTPSIFKAQQTVDLHKKENAVLELKGRHDACIVPRAVPVAEAAAALVLFDMMNGGAAWQNI
ncbi:MAG: chorismate synthase [Ruminococcaceae bacterium]|nr:chorismate synthase [Oscillospiraceae bacterium]